MVRHDAKSGMMIRLTSGTVLMALQRVILACCFSLLFIDIGDATSIIVVRTPQAVTIAADSKRIYDDGARIESACKIHRVGNILITVAGVTGLGIMNFDIAEHAKRAVSASRSLSEVVVEFDRTIGVPLDEMTQMLWKSDPVFSREYLDYWFVHLTFVGLEKGEPAFITRKYKPRIKDNKLRLEIFRYSCPGDCLNGSEGMFMGTFELIKTKHNENPYLLAGNTVAETNRLIEIEIEANPDKVGAPIEIVKFTKDRIEWLQDDLHCGDNGLPQSR